MKKYTKTNFLITCTTTILLAILLFVFWSLFELRFVIELPETINTIIYFGKEPLIIVVLLTCYMSIERYCYLELIENKLQKHYEKKQKVYERVAGILILSALTFWNLEGIICIIARSEDYLNEVEIYIVVKAIISFCWIVCLLFFVKITRIREVKQGAFERKKLIRNVILLVLFISLWAGSSYINWKAESVYFQKLEEAFEKN